jgi:hypothetical protein
MVAGIIFLIGLMLLITQLMIQGASGQWPSITLASELGLPADRVYTDWMVVDAGLRFLLGEVPLWLVLVFAAAAIYWLTDFTDEKLARLFGRRPTALPEPASPLADGGTQA